ncbi:hypothetical protein BH23CHL9_BH23CHL9_15830 [soil metagenome]
MSREERRNYERMMKSMERGPVLPPAAKARAERNAVRRSQRRQQRSAEGFLAARFVVRSLIIAGAIGFMAFSFQWPNMPFAAYVGLIVGGVALAVLAGIRLLTRRRAPSPD